MTDSPDAPERRPSLLHPRSEKLALVLRAQPRDIGDFPVRRALPAVSRRHVGPFLFVDHLGPTELAEGQGMDVGPHPHIGLATVTYLFEGVITHRDSLGTRQEIRPGDINWMTAGRGITHSERTPPEERGPGKRARIHGVQAWVGLPLELEEIEPSFRHYPRETLPVVTVGEASASASIVVLVGTAYGQTSPVVVTSPTLSLEINLDPDASVKLPDDQPELAFYVVEGAVSVDDETFLAGDLVVVAPKAAVGEATTVQATCQARLLVFGGAPLDGPRRMVWNFVSSSEERIERATEDWREGRFPPVFDDDAPGIPFPSARSTGATGATGSTRSK
jgi:redox-sensitive bicupin YhaK (pirin superfamily)